MIKKTRYISPAKFLLETFVFVFMTLGQSYSYIIIVFKYVLNQDKQHLEIKNKVRGSEEIW